MTTLDRAVPATTVTAGRSRDIIARDQARVTQLLASARAERCVTRYAALRLANVIAVGHVRTTVADIRRYMRCSQACALQLRHRVLAMADFEAPAVIDSEAVDAVAPSRPRLVHSLPARVA
ncbi:hypothetical protein WS67_22410 [Burkholderia singularis]|uniref:Uncharacterized protein n=1 Tax=Burkholderia singularis TaxID=1503053 RepID=A0A124P7V9_9BURK|nr:hypothetical protein WS67_22410 [Burkholderia singularis]